MREPSGLPWHSLSAKEVLGHLRSDGDRGLSTHGAAVRFAEHGPNALPEKKGRSLAALYLAQFQNPLIYLLIGAAGIAAAVGNRGDALGILAVLAFNAAIGALQEGRAQRSMEDLRRVAALHCLVLRDGVQELLEARDLVPGDLLLLSAGDAVGADARILHAASLEVNEGILTGESLPVGKSAEPVPGEVPLADRTSMAYAGTHVTGGRARAVVVATGTRTEMGQLASVTEATEEPRTPLERRIDGFGRRLLVAALVMFTSLVGIGLLRGIPFAEIFMVAVSQLVSMVPEGLPVAITIGLAVGMQRMARRKAIVRRLAAVESLGSTTVICSDKTGTLTRNEIAATVVRLPSGREIEVSGNGYTPEGSFLEGGREVRPSEDPDLVSLLEAAALCNDASLKPPEADDPRWRPLGDPTEAALVTLARKGGIDPEVLRRRHPRRGEIPFDSATKMMATAHDGRIYLKGAPEVLLRRCASARRGGAPAPLDEAGRAALVASSQEMAARALRVLALAVIEEGSLDPARGFDALGEKAVLLGLVGEFDPPRPEARKAVELCRRAGVRPIMITGDHKATGLAVARLIGIAGDGDVAIEGHEIERMSPEELSRVVDRVSVFARVHPLQKVGIVEALQSRGAVVAMTGDGVNDAPALARADVGVAMGMSGTEVAKQAADIVVTDDNFATLVRAVEEGRVVYANLKKVILLLFSTGLAELAVLFGALLVGFPIPFTAIQILWNNVVTEGTITVNLVMEPREGNEMSRPPIPRDEPILTRGLLGRMLSMSLTISVVTLGFFALRLAQGVPFPRVQTATFTLLAVCEWFNVLNCRSETRSALKPNWLRNPWIFGGLLVSLLLQSAVVYLPALHSTFHTVPLPLSEVAWIAAAGSLVLWVEEARKALARSRASRSPLLPRSPPLLD